MMTRVLLLLVPLLLFGAPARSATKAEPARATILTGYTWLGLWRDGRVVVSRHMDGWTFAASRLSKDRRTLEVAANRKAATEDEHIVLLFDARTLAPRGRRIDPSLNLDLLRMPIGTDLTDPDDAALLRRLPRRAPAGRVRRVVVSPDRSTAAIFVQPAAKDAPWRGTAIDLRTGKRLGAPGLFIDDGTRSENGAARAIACLLPDGEGVIYTLLGAPGDTLSEVQRFGNVAAAPIQLETPYVTSCLTPG